MPCRPLSCACCKYIAPMRHVQAVMALFALVVMYGHRVSINLALVEMVPPFHSKQGVACLKGDEVAPTLKNISGGVKPWNEQTQSYILGSFYIGYTVFQIPCGYCIDIFGARIFLLLGIGISTIMAAVVPLIVHHMHWWFLVGSRVIMGGAQCVIYPCIAYVLSHWIPAQEWSTISSVCMSGMALGTVIGTLATGFILKIFNSWVIVFYFWAGVGVFWFIFGVMYVYDAPEKHKNISEEEKQMLEESLAKKTHLKPPICRILLDMVTWALTMGQVVNDYAFYTLLNNLPKYMNNVLGFDITKNTFHTALPQLALFLTSVSAGRFADFLIKRKNYNVLWVRIIMTGIGTVLSPAFIVAAGYVGCNHILAVLCFNLSLLFKGPMYGGLKVNILDVTINYSATLMAIMNACASMMGFLAPYVIGIIAKDNTLQQWRLVFWIVFYINVGGFVFYVIFTKTRRRYWDYSIEEQATLPPKPTSCCRLFSWYKPPDVQPTK